MKKWLLNCIEFVMVFVILIVCIISRFQDTLFKNDSVFGYKTYFVASNSMYPLFEYGDIILIKEILYDNIKVGDIVTYQGLVGEFEDKVITHEVIDIFYENEVKVLKTKGLSNNDADPNVYENQFYGKFIYKFVLISFVSKIVKNEIGFMLFVFIPFVILVILEFVNIVKEIKRRKLEKKVKEQLEELKKIDRSNKETLELEKTMCVQLEQIKYAKRDFKKMNELERTVRIPLEDIIKKIEFFKNIENKEKNEELLFDKTVVLFNNDDIRKEINKEIKLKNKKTK